jgi:hypothetical protein
MRLRGMLARGCCWRNFRGCSIGLNGCGCTFAGIAILFLTCTLGLVVRYILQRCFGLVHRVSFGIVLVQMSRLCGCRLIIDQNKCNTCVGYSQET